MGNSSGGGGVVVNLKILFGSENYVTSIDNVSNTMGSLLVREASVVPIPTAAWLFSSGPACRVWSAWQDARKRNQHILINSNGPIKGHSHLRGTPPVGRSRFGNDKSCPEHTRRQQRQRPNASGQRTPCLRSNPEAPEVSGCNINYSRREPTCL